MYAAIQRGEVKFLRKRVHPDGRSFRSSQDGGWGVSRHAPLSIWLLRHCNNRSRYRWVLPFAAKVLAFAHSRWPTGWLIVWKCVLAKMPFVQEIFDLDQSKKRKVEEPKTADKKVQ
jgi:hypothetical protein